MTHEMVIVNEDEIIGIVKDIKSMVIEQLRRGTIDDYEMTRDLFNELKSFKDGEYVTCWYHPMGSWYVTKGEQYD